MSMPPVPMYDCDCFCFIRWRTSQVQHGEHREWAQQANVKTWKQRETQGRKGTRTGEDQHRSATKASELHSLIHLTKTLYNNRHLALASDAWSRGEWSPQRCVALALLSTVPRMVRLSITLIASSYNKWCADVVAEVAPRLVMTGQVFWKGWEGRQTRKTTGVSL